ncbi:hypothetical protein WSM22_39980 [Cytophagales bacterium WSM2-2]|nr:hypothetical protein WSM22_39980 [Cytophagales bacterium WSM2-2]
MESLFKAKNVEISYDPVHKYMYCNWIGFQNKQSIMETGGIILDLFKKKEISKILNDNSRVTGPWQDSAEWTATVWFPEMIKAGLRHFAWIFSANIFAELSAKKAMPANEIVKSFNSLEEARKWLIDAKVPTSV